MYNSNLSLKLVTKCTVTGDDILDFRNKMNSCGYYTYIEDYYEDEEFSPDDEVDVMVFKLMSNKE